MTISCIMSKWEEFSFLVFLLLLLIKFPQHDFNQSETEIDDKKLSQELYEKQKKTACNVLVEKYDILVKILIPVEDHLSLGFSRKSRFWLNTRTLIEHKDFFENTDFLVNFSVG